MQYKEIYLVFSQLNSCHLKSIMFFMVGLSIALWSTHFQEFESICRLQYQIEKAQIMIPIIFTYSSFQNTEIPCIWPSNPNFYPIVWNANSFLGNQPDSIDNAEPVPIQPNISPVNPNEIINYEEIDKKQTKSRGSLRHYDQEQYRPEEDIEKNNRLKKKYEKQSDRNILPNIVNKLFSFVGCRFRNYKLVEAFLKENPNIRQFCTAKKFFIYHKQLKASLNKFLKIEDLMRLFKVDTKVIQISQSQFESIVRINCFLVRYYFRNSLHVIGTVNSTRVSPTKTQKYLREFRNIQEKIEELIHLPKVKEEK